jgi:hypothetical protein
MDDFQLPGLWNLTPTAALIGLVLLVALFYMRGWAVPRATHERELAARDAAHATNLAQANHRGDEWKETALAGRKVIEGQTETIRIMAEGQRTTADFFGTVKGGDHVAT